MFEEGMSVKLVDNTMFYQPLFSHIPIGTTAIVLRCDEDSADPQFMTVCWKNPEETGGVLYGRHAVLAFASEDGPGTTVVRMPIKCSCCQYKRTLEVPTELYSELTKDMSGISFLKALLPFLPGQKMMITLAPAERKNSQGILTFKIKCEKCLLQGK